MREGQCKVRELVRPLQANHEPNSGTDLFWVKELPSKTTEEECAISNKSIVDWYNFAGATIIEESTQIGGVGEVVEIDESIFGQCKYHKGRRVDEVWVFGGIDTRTRQCFLVTVEDHSEATLIPIIQKYIKPGTTNMSDCWKAYSKFVYKHRTVNHSVEFVNSATGDHTQTIESTSRSVKGFVIFCHILPNTLFIISTSHLTLTSF